MPRTSRTNELTPIKRGRIVQGHKDGIPKKNLAKTFDCFRVTINRTIDRFEQNGSFEDRPRPGRPNQYLSERTERRILEAIQRDKWNGWARVAEDIGDVSRQAVQRVAHKNK